MSVKSSLFKQPIVHFLLLGVLLFTVDRYWQQQHRQTIDPLDAETLQELRDDWVRQTGRMPSPQQMRAIQQQELDNRILFAEALRRNYHRDDTVVLQRLLRDAQFLGIEGSDEEKIRAAISLGVHLSDEVIKRRMIQRVERMGRVQFMDSPDEIELEALYDSERERWLVPARYSFKHVFYSGDRSEDPILRAKNDLAVLEQGGLASLDAQLGDPFLHGRSVKSKSLQDLTFMFGAQFSDALRARDIMTERWFGPIPSAYGAHLIRVTEIYPQYLRSYSEVKPKVAQLWRDEQERQSLRQYIEQLRQEYGVAEPKTAEEGQP